MKEKFLNFAGSCKGYALELLDSLLDRIIAVLLCIIWAIIAVFSPGRALFAIESFIDEVRENRKTEGQD